jgi:HEAT repeat protein
LTGCANTFDDITRRDHDFGRLFTTPDPLVVLKDSSDGSDRARALASLQEPKENGGTAADQDKMLEILRISALQDDQALCRMSAIRSLGRFKDPRAAEILDQVYVQDLRFEPELISLIHEECLKSLAETGGPVALHRLVLVAKEPPAAGAARLKQEALGRRLTAVRGLGKFKDPEAVATLAYVLKTDKDIAIKDRAHEALEAATGKHAPPDSPVWAAYAPAAPATPVAQPTVQPAGGPAASNGVNARVGWSGAP